MKEWHLKCKMQFLRCMSGMFFPFWGELMLIVQSEKLDLCLLCIGGDPQVVFCKNFVALNCVGKSGV